MTTNAKKSEHLLIKVTSRNLETLSEAAQMAGTTPDKFMVQAALEKAHQMIKQEKMIRLSSRDAAVFIQAIENPPGANQKLLNAFAMYRKAISGRES